MLDIEQVPRWHLEERRRIDRIELPSWSRVIVAIDGHDVAGELAEVGVGWALVVTRKGKAVDVFAAGPRPDTIALSRVTTLQPYIEGLQALQQRRRLEHGF